MGTAVLTRSRSRSSSSFSGAWLNWTNVSIWARRWHFSFYVLVVLILAILSGCWSFWIYHITRLYAGACSTVLSFWKVIWEFGALSILLIRIRFITFALSWNTRKLLLTLRYRYSVTASTRLKWWIWPKSWSTTCGKPHFLFVNILLDC